MPVAHFTATLVQCFGPLLAPGLRSQCRPSPLLCLLRQLPASGVPRWQRVASRGLLPSERPLARLLTAFERW